MLRLKERDATVQERNAPRQTLEDRVQEIAELRARTERLEREQQHDVADAGRDAAGATTVYNCRHHRRDGVKYDHQRKYGSG